MCTCTKSDKTPKNTLTNTKMVYILDVETPITADEMTALAEIIASVKARVEKEVKELYPQNMTDPVKSKYFVRSFTIDSIHQETMTLYKFLVNNKLI